MISEQNRNDEMEWRKNLNAVGDVLILRRVQAVYKFRESHQLRRLAG
jgi:hypothetical protein